MAYEFKLLKRIEFYETDMAGIVHFSNYFRFMEMAEAAFFRSLNLSIQPINSKPKMGWPRVVAKCEYLSPLCFEDKIEIHLLIENINKRSITYRYIISKIKDEKKQVAAKGKIKIVCVTFDADGHSMKSTNLPREMTDKIEVAPKAVLDQALN